MKWLACMRMVCDTPYILDPDCRISPKLRELESILEERLEDDGVKLIVFSEWERMLELVRELADAMPLDYAWHTGSTPQTKRRDEIRRFKNDPGCRLFLSTDSGSVGLNLQAASVVINVDIPWNPARLEQRIARAWRKHQTRSVQVINLVCENSIEHRMLHMLEQKRTLAEGVVDGAGGLTEMTLPSGRAAFVERLEGLMGRPVPSAEAPPPPPVDPLERFREDAVARLHERLDLLAVYGDDSRRTVLAVVDRADPAADDLLQQALGEQPPETRLEVLDRGTYDTIQRLIDAGVLSLNEAAARTLHQSPLRTRQRGEALERRLAEARAHFEKADRKRRMAAVLAEGGFPVEALAPLREAVELGLRALGRMAGEDDDASPSLGFIESRLVSEGLAPPEAPALVARLRQELNGGGEPAARALFESGGRLLDHAAEALDKAALRA